MSAVCAVYITETDNDRIAVVAAKRLKSFLFYSQQFA